jgi:hypothetical protein
VASLGGRGRGGRAAWNRRPAAADDPPSWPPLAPIVRYRTPVELTPVFQARRPIPDSESELTLGCSAGPSNRHTGLEDGPSPSSLGSRRVRRNFRFDVLDDEFGNLRGDGARCRQLDLEPAPIEGTWCPMDEAVPLDSVEDARQCRSMQAELVSDLTRRTSWFAQDDREDQGLWSFEPMLASRHVEPTSDRVVCAIDRLDHPLVGQADALRRPAIVGDVVEGHGRADGARGRLHSPFICDQRPVSDSDCGVRNRRKRRDGSGFRRRSKSDDLSGVGDLSGAGGRELPADAAPCGRGRGRRRARATCGLPQDDERVDVDTGMAGRPHHVDLELVGAGRGPRVLVDDLAELRRRAVGADRGLVDAVHIDPE